MQNHNLINKIGFINELSNIINNAIKDADNLLLDIRTNTYAFNEYMRKNEVLLEMYANIINATYIIEQLSDEVEANSN